MTDTISLEDLDDTKTTKACDALEEAFEKLRRSISCFTSATYSPKASLG